MKKNLISIIIIIGILCMVVGIYIFKNNERNQNMRANVGTIVENEQLELKQVDDKIDFSLEVTDNLNIDNMKLYNLPIILDFGSEGCGPCRAMAPALKEINKRMQGKAFIKFMDIWAHSNLANGYPIELIPTQFFINCDGTPLDPEKVSEVKLQKIVDKDGNHIFTRHMGGLTVEQFEYILEGMGVNE